MHRVSKWGVIATALLLTAGPASGFMVPAGRFVNKSIADTTNMRYAMYVSSPAFKNGGSIPARYARPAAGGLNMSIPLKWSGAPPGTKSFALSIVDHHPVAHLWVHWMVLNIPAEVMSLPEGASGRQMPSGSIELANSFGNPGYGGPQPPRGSGPHAYVITVYALSVARLALDPNTTLAGFSEALDRKTLGKASMTGYFQK
ncbi:MAG: YbhB/YbcL family Raf kinase inhibitor-like protein [Syntrophobacteraceae bacterium]|nr:YbhB/YbcL family Raf kinase inhibitor-like protein [Syntrophobacteraceae bacterium]